MSIEPTAIAVQASGRIEISETDIENVKEFPNILAKFYKTIMQEGTDYGTIPGTQKPSLWKPGAEILTIGMHLSSKTEIVSKIENVDKDEPFFSYTAECKVYSQSGYIGNGFGSANSREVQYAYRWVFERDLPAELLASHDQLETRKTRGDVQYRIPSTPSEVFSRQNDLVKKAKKRAFIDAVLTVTGASRIFTQDIEDSAEPGEVPQQKGEAAKQPRKDVTPPREKAQEPEFKEATGAVTKEQLEYELRDFGDDVGVVEEQDGLKVEIRNKLPNSRFDALAALLGTYKATKSFQGSSMYFKIRKTSS